ncbi:MAG: helix-turn-helix transcriptional regulator [Prevotella sp.]|nr:helix-turn-helix transcriptional regulator [Prevotella sp.]
MKKLDIKRALREHNMTQVELCKKTGLLTQNMSPIINGNPTLSKLMQIAEGIGCDITDLFYPDPAEEVEERKKALESAKNSKMPLELILRDLTRRAYPGITKEEADEWLEVIRNKNMVPWFDLNTKEPRRLADMIDFEATRKKHEGETLNATLWGDIPEGVIERDVNFVQQAAGSEPAYPVHGNGLVSENQQQMIQTSTFCPHCGKKVRVGVVLLNVEC